MRGENPVLIRDLLRVGGFQGALLVEAPTLTLAKPVIDSIFAMHDTQRHADEMQSDSRAGHRHDGKWIRIPLG